MSDNPSILLSPTYTEPSGDEFTTICRWPFADPYVNRLLREDVPQRARSGNGRITVYRDPAGEPVGFGTIDVCNDYGSLTGNRLHPYIPLLAVRPGYEGRGYGTFIVRHLIGEAALISCRGDGCHDVLFLDVYTSNAPAIALYRKCGFVNIKDEPLLDAIEKRTYFVMARKVSIAHG